MGGYGGKLLDRAVRGNARCQEIRIGKNFRPKANATKSRSWRAATDGIIFSRDLLADPDDETLAAIVEFASSVYGIAVA